MKHSAIISVLFAVGLCAEQSAIAQGALQKCIDASGKIAYQDTPCEAGKKAVAEIRRDRTTGDPLSIKRANDERERSQQFTLSRAKQSAAEDANAARIAAGEAMARARAESEDRADARALMAAQPQGIYLPVQPIVIRETIKIENNARPQCTGSNCKR